MDVPSSEPPIVELSLDGGIGVTELFQSEREHLVRLAAALTYAPDEVQDVVQQAFASLQSRGSHVNDPEWAAAYLRLGVINTARLTHRRRRADAEWYPVPEEEYQDIIRAVRRLPRCQQQVVALRYWSGLSDTQIAGVLGLSLISLSKAAGAGLPDEGLLRQAFAAIPALPWDETVPFRAGRFPDRRRYWAVAAGVAALLVLAGGLIWSERDRPEPLTEVAAAQFHTSTFAPLNPAQQATVAAYDRYYGLLLDAANARTVPDDQAWNEVTTGDLKGARQQALNSFSASGIPDSTLLRVSVRSETATVTACWDSDSPRRKVGLRLQEIDGRWLAAGEVVSSESDC
jgi:DNA-directed RNA polymerase specialized sigma24 family protein